MSESLDKVERQNLNEGHFDRRQIEGMFRKFLNSSVELLELTQLGTDLITEWSVNIEHQYESKRIRAGTVAEMDAEKLIEDIAVLSLMIQKPEPLINITGRLADRLGWSIHREALVAAGELLAIIAHTNLYTISKASKESQLMIESNVNLPDELLSFIDQAGYLPPMICKPNELTNNFESAYLTVKKDCVILKKHNQHSGEVSLDVINIKNSVPLSIYVPMASTIQEMPSKAFESVEAQSDFYEMSAQSLRIVQMLMVQGNRFYLPHKVDKRGRLYAQGYHINSQGTGYKKAILDFADPEIIEVPEYLRN